MFLWCISFRTTRKRKAALTFYLYYVLLEFYTKPHGCLINCSLYRVHSSRPTHYYNMVCFSCAWKLSIFSVMTKSHSSECKILIRLILKGIPFAFPYCRPSLNITIKIFFSKLRFVRVKSYKEIQAGRAWRCYHSPSTCVFIGSVCENWVLLPNSTGMHFVCSATFKH